MKIKMHSMSRNMSASFACRVVALLSGLVVQRYILLAFGSAYNGLTSLISQVMSYLVLLEAGLGVASIQAFYAPLNNGDREGVSGIMNATSLSYRKVGIIFAGLLVGGSLLVPLATQGEIDFFIAGLLTLITGAGNVATYFLGGKSIALLSADRKMYAIYEMDIATTICSTVLRVIALQNGKGIIFVQSIHLFFVILKNIILTVYVNKFYPWLNKNVAPNFKAISKRWNVLIHSIAGLVVNHTDILILTVAASLKLVSVYNIYYMIYGQIGNVIQTTFLQAPQGEFGRVLHKDKKAFEELYTAYEVLYSILLFIVTTIALVLTRPFVILYTAGVTDVNYIDSWLPVLFAIVLILNQIRCPAILTINAEGAFKETQRGAIVEAIINLTISLALFVFTDLGVYGLLIGTICSYLYRTVDVIYYVYKNVVSRRIYSFLRLFIVNFVCAGGIWYLFCVKFSAIAGNYWQWLGLAISQGMMIVIIFAVFNFIFNNKDTFLAVKRVVCKLKIKK